ncbi:hypothetical protein FB382_001984 [Nocardioides ginsengisegetis]|uniref:Uncharacterized protein n=1 Tax=Nocardioides ginsengisegetis TaxID=661491 RepID=A0A7W3IZT8_9ACTN|nr:hypothetical protein [Nocardioides ginsengisegetis]MBA8803693.1 hypothetical protein [Nocardioides ginsengisegetis]
MLGVLVAAAMTAGITDDGADGLPELSEAQISAAREQGVIIEVDHDRGPVDEAMAARLLAAAHVRGDPKRHQVLAVSRGAFRYAQDEDAARSDDAWLVAVSNVAAICFGGDLCPHPPDLGTEVVALTADTLDPIGDYWVFPSSD